MADEFLSIGKVVDELSGQFKGVSVSKIRFLESEGLIKPTRTQGGYRKFTRDDLDDLRAILRMQSDEYLPLSVIKQRLKDMPRNGTRETPVGGGPASSKADVFPGGQIAVDAGQLAKLSGVSETTVNELVKVGMITHTPGDDGEPSFDQRALGVVEIARELGRYGLEPRHMRMYTSFVGREAALCSQILGVSPKRTSESRQKARVALDEFTSALSRLRTSLLEDNLKTTFKDLYED